MSFGIGCAAWMRGEMARQQARVETMTEGERSRERGFALRAVSRSLATSSAAASGEGARARSGTGHRRERGGAPARRSRPGCSHVYGRYTTHSRVVFHVGLTDPKVVESELYTPSTAFFTRSRATYRPQGVVGQCIQQYITSVPPIHTQSVVIHTHTHWPTRPWAWQY